MLKERQVKVIDLLDVVERWHMISSFYRRSTSDRQPPTYISFFNSLLNKYLLSSEDGLTRLVNISVSISRTLTTQTTFLAGLLGPIRSNAKRLFKSPEEIAQDVRRIILLC